MSDHQLAAADTLRGYDQWAPAYDAVTNPLVEATAWRLSAAPPPWTGADVVELGCGTGRHAAAILAAGADSYTGVDGSAGMLAQARARGDDPRLTWIEADLHAHLPLPDACCDLLLMVLVLEHITTLPPLFAEMARLLRPGGSLRLLEIHPELLGAGRNAHFQHGDTEVRFTSHVHPVDSLRAALTGAGLAIDEAATRTFSADELTPVVPRFARRQGLSAMIDLVAGR